jgi:flagellar biosynthesis/type III secretory pathway protein FliH
METGKVTLTFTLTPGELLALLDEVKGKVAERISKIDWKKELEKRLTDEIEEELEDAYDDGFDDGYDAGYADGYMKAKKEAAHNGKNA